MSSPIKLAAAALILSGCVILPTPATPVRDIPPQHREALTAAQTTRVDILMRYGAPDLRLRDDRVLVYHWPRVRAAVVLLFPALGGGTIDDVEAVFLEFDGTGRLARMGTGIAWQKQTIAEQAEAWAAKPPGSTP